MPSESSTTIIARLDRIPVWPYGNTLLAFVGNYGWLAMAPTLLTEHAGYRLTSSLSFLVVRVSGSCWAPALLLCRPTERTTTTSLRQVPPSGRSLCSAWDCSPTPPG